MLEKKHKYWTKICGVARKADADSCVDKGADAIGVLINLEDTYTTKRDKLSLVDARDMIEYVKGRVQSVMLVHETEIDKAISQIRFVDPKAIQMQSALTPADCVEIKSNFPELVVIKTIHVDSDSDLVDLLQVADAYRAVEGIDAFLVDSRLNGRTGGTGRTHDWRISRAFVDKLDGFPVILAGGLGSKNVESAIDNVRPWGVDVMSGVSVSPGVKSDQLIAAFLAEVKIL